MVKIKSINKESNNKWLLSGLWQQVQQLIVQFGRAEAKLHNVAMEKVAKEREKWSEERQQRLDYLNKRIAERKHAARTFANLEVAEEEYYRVTVYRLSPLRDKPKLSDFYNPSRHRKDAEIVLVVAMSILGLLAYTMKK